MNFDTVEEFNKAAKEKYGDKIYVGLCKVSPELLEKMNAELGTNFTDEELIKEIGEIAIPIDNKCPECGEDLLGLFGTFTWGIHHGEGSCSGCSKTLFWYYHYIAKGKKPLSFLQLVGF